MGREIKVGINNGDNFKMYDWRFEGERHPPLSGLSNFLEKERSRDDVPISPIYIFIKA